MISIVYTARAMGDAPKEIKIRNISNCMKADPAYGKGVADALGISLSEVSSTSKGIGSFSASQKGHKRRL